VSLSENMRNAKRDPYDPAKWDAGAAANRTLPSKDKTPVTNPDAPATGTFHDNPPRYRDPSRKIITVVGTPRCGSTSVYFTLKRSSGGMYGLSEPCNFRLFPYRGPDAQKICRPLMGPKWEVNSLLNYLTSCDVEMAKLMVGQHHDSSDLWSWDLRDLVRSKVVSKVVLMYRENLLKQALSMCIATNTQFWHGSPKEQEKAYAKGVGRIDLVQFTGCLNALRSVNDVILSAIQVAENPSNLYIVKYEDFFETPLEEQSEHWEKLHEFVGFNYSPEILDCDVAPDMPLAPSESHARRAASPNSVRYNGPSTYATINNLPEVEATYREFLQRDAAYVRDMIKFRQPLPACSLGMEVQRG
jgi:hypothetical protein